MADSLYFGFIKNSLKVKKTEIPAVKFDAIDKTKAIEIADLKYSEWLKKSLKVKQLEIPALKFDATDKKSAVEIADSKYFKTQPTNSVPVNTKQPTDKVKVKNSKK